MVINCFGTYAFAMWKLRCEILHDAKKGLKFTKINNKIHAHYLERDLLLPINHKLFHLSLARMLAQTTTMKEDHLLGFKSAKLRLEASQDPDNLKNVVNPNHRKHKKKKAKPSKHRHRRQNSDNTNTRHNTSTLRTLHCSPTPSYQTASPHHLRIPAYFYPQNLLCDPVTLGHLYDIRV
jgi:hypothetical protein